MDQPSQINGSAFEYYSRLKRIKDYVERFYSEDITLEDAARVAGVEKTYFSTFFRQKVGITFSEWLRRQRITRAMEIMRTQDRTISEIAHEVGFGDLRTFERAFKKYAQTTPSDYKQSLTQDFKAAAGC